MVSDSEVREAVYAAKETLKEQGIDCRTTADELLLWFQADTPFDDGTEFETVMASPLLVIHELVEIGEVKHMGLALTKDVIVKNLEKIDDAHLKAARVELQIAASQKDLGHLLRRVEDVKMWSKDGTVAEANRKAYGDMYGRTMDTISAIKRTRRKRMVIASVAGGITALDVIMAVWVVPWADEHYTTGYGSLGYVVTFLTVFATFIAVLGLATYHFQRDSYASDRWQ